ncbi:MAG: ATP phosphoribosyltransferase regulatory subunit [Devosiaceae bacterium]|nr:ATP phosphoribosyltransferase regulatory subunit [Devosiaceae bacterium]
MSFDQQHEALNMLVKQAGKQSPGIPILLPASDYFDLAGEEFGRRLVLTTGADGTAWCMRPDFTLPIAKSFITKNSAKPTAITYMGRVFRQRQTRPAEFEQAGLELFAHPEGDAALRQVFSFISKAFSIFDISSPIVRLGSIELFENLLDALEMPDVWRPRVLRRFGNENHMAELFVRLESAPETGEKQHIATKAQLLEQITEQMVRDGINPLEGRRPEEIADRYLEKQTLAAARVPEKTIEILRAYLSISAPVEQALEKIEQLLSSNSLNVQGGMDRIASNANTLSLNMAGAQVNFDAGFSPRLHYYTGLVFEICGREGKILASGGEYDRLLKALGAKENICATGCSLWVKRLVGRGQNG